MKFHEQKLPGVFLIEPEPFKDDRGVFRRHFCKKEFEARGLDSRVSQANVSENLFKHTLRGFHYQLFPHGEDKTISCLKGSLYDIVVDLRVDSPTYLKWIHVDITAENRMAIHVPKGCANAFFTMEDNTLAQYYVSEFYHPQSEAGIRYNDPTFKFEWPTKPAHISKKDETHPDFNPEIGSYRKK